MSFAALFQDELLPAFSWCSETSDLLFYHLLLSPGGSARKDIAAAGNSPSPYTKTADAHCTRTLSWPVVLVASLS